MTDVVEPIVETTSAAEALVMSETIAGTLEQVWDAFTTSEGQMRWQVAHADIDLRVGGLMRTHYEPEGRIGDENTIHNLILSYDPLCMISFRIVAPPKQFPFKTAAESVWTVLYFEAAGDGHTRVTVKMLGWPDTDESRQMRAFFERGNRWVLDKLRDYFAKG